MPNRKGFSLIEIITVLVIVAILAAIALPSYNTQLLQGAAKSAQDTLISIYSAEKSYYYGAGNGTYCTGACNGQNAINNTLNLNINDTMFNYSCAADASGFACTATSPSIVGSLIVKNNPVVLPGGAGALNPVCTLTAIYCPN